MEHGLKWKQQNFLQASLGLTVVCCSMLALWVPLVSHYPHASWGKKETINFMIPERVRKSQQCLRNVWRLKPLIQLHSKNERINKTYFGSSIPTPHSKTTNSVPVPCRPEGGGILEACEAPLLSESDTGTGASLNTCGIDLTWPDCPRQCRTGAVSGWSALVLGEKKHIAHQDWVAYLGWCLQPCLQTPFQSTGLVELCSGKGPRTIAKSLSGLVFHGLGPSFTV